MLELQEAPENMLLCPTEVRHLGTTGRPAEHRDKAHDQKFAKVMTRVVGPGIGDVIEGGEEDIHAGNGLQEGRSPLQNPSPRKPQDPSGKVSFQTRFPCHRIIDLYLVVAQGRHEHQIRVTLLQRNPMACPVSWSIADTRYGGSMERVIDRFKTVLKALMVIMTSTTTSLADMSNRCQVSEDPEYIARFKAAYLEFTGGAQFGDHPIHVLDCGYLLIIEEPLPPRTFGSNTAYLFVKEGFHFITAIMFD